MSNFTCPKCSAKVTHAHSVGCPACGFGKNSHNEHVQRPVQKPTVEAPPGFQGGYLTEDR